MALTRWNGPGETEQVGPAYARSAKGVAMTRSNNPVYALIGAGAVAAALWAGMPPVFLLFLACPVMMLFMMGGMQGNQHHDDSNKTPRSETTTPDTADRPR